MSVTNEIDKYMAQKIAFLSSNSPAAKAMLAKLRRAAGKDPVDTPEVWEITLDGLPDLLSGRYYDGAYHPSDSERAVHAALTIYAVQAQGSSTSPHVIGISLGEAAGKLSASMKGNDTIKKRFGSIITASDVTELAHHLRGLAQLFRSKGDSGMDYVMLAKDLYLYSNTERRSNVLFRWGEDFFSLKTSNNPVNDKEE